MMAGGHSSTAPATDEIKVRSDEAELLDHEEFDLSFYCNFLKDVTH